MITITYSCLLKSNELNYSYWYIQWYNAGLKYIIKGQLVIVVEAAAIFYTNKCQERPSQKLNFGETT